MSGNNPYILCAAVLIFLGTVLRVEPFLDNCSLNVDEASTAVDVCSRSFRQILTHELAYSDLPTRPIGQLLVYKLFVTLFGNADWVYRIFPLFCGIASIFLFWTVVQDFVAPQARLIALGLFALSEHLIAYSVSVKQYSCDTFVALLIYLMFIRLQRKGITVRETRLYGFLGVVCIFFSYTSVFVLAALGLSQLLFDPHHKKFSKENGWLVTYWVMGFVVLYLKYFRYMTESPTIMISAQPWFMPLNGQVFAWMARSFAHVMEDPVGLSAPALAGALFVAGGWVAYRKSRREWIMLFGPVLLVLIASGLKKYPFFERYILFIVPAMIVFISQGIGALMSGPSNKYVRWAGIILLGILFYMPVKKAGAGGGGSSCEFNSRPIMQYFRENYRLTDDVYLNTNSQYLFWHYGNMLKINPVLSVQPCGEWYGQELFGRTVGEFEDYVWNNQGKDYIVISFDTYGYNQAGIFQNKYSDYDVTHSLFLYEDTAFTLPEQKRVWLLFLHSMSPVTDFAIRKFTADAKILRKIDAENSVMYLLEKK